MWLAAWIIAMSASAGDLAPGRYALSQVYTLQVRPPVIGGRWTDATTRSWSVIGVQRDGNDVSWTETVCHLESDKVLGTVTEYPDSFVAVMDGLQRTGRLQDGRLISSYTDLVGAEGGTGTPLDDLRPVDADEDGHPGVTLGVQHSVMGRGELYVGQRSHVELDGEVLADGSVEGLVDGEPEPVIFGASKWWLTVEPQRRTHPDPKMNRFRMEPLDADATCADVLERRDALLARGQDYGGLP